MSLSPSPSSCCTCVARAESTHRQPPPECAICKEEIPPCELAIVDGCAHRFCVTCIVISWYSTASPTCPLCRRPFFWLYLRRDHQGRCLHGPSTLTDFPPGQLHSVCLLRNAEWLNIPASVFDAISDGQFAPRLRQVPNTDQLSSLFLPPNVRDHARFRTPSQEQNPLQPGESTDEDDGELQDGESDSGSEMSLDSPDPTL